VNAAILLVTSAWMTGQAPEVIIPVQHHAPAASACGNGCGNGGGCCDDGGGFGHRMRGRLHGLFNRGHGNDCCEQVVEVDCCASRGHRLFGHRRDSCDSCDTGHGRNDCGCGGPGLFERFRNLFHRDRGCCEDACCDSGAHPAPAGGVIMPGEPLPGRPVPPGAEPLKEQPKKLPNKAGAPARQTRVITPAVETPLAPGLQDAPAINAPAINAPAAPAVNVPAINPPATSAPAIAPRIIETERNPF
jgi:hypothetical protein